MEARNPFCCPACHRVDETYLVIDGRRVSLFCPMCMIRSQFRPNTYVRDQIFEVLGSAELPREERHVDRGTGSGHLHRTVHSNGKIPVAHGR
jgi:hypothetical protein